MDNYETAVIAFLGLYRFAKIKNINVNPTDNVDYYTYIIKKVHNYLKQLEPFEVKILTQRYFHDKSLNQIAISMHYKSHSSVSRILSLVIKKLAQYEANL